MSTRKQPFYLRPAIEQALGMAQAVRCGGLLFVGAVNAMDDGGAVSGPGDMAAQLSAVYANLGRILDAHGASFENVLRETVYTVDMTAFWAHLQVRLDVYEGLPPPALTCVPVARMLAPDVLVAIEVIAEVVDAA